MEKQEIISSGLLEMYVIGATSAEETLQVEHWRSMYSQVDEEIINIEKSFEAYAFANAITPSSSIKEQIFNTLKASENTVSNNSNEHSAKVISISPWRNIAAAAAVLLLIGSSVLNFFYYNKYKDVNAKYNESQQQVASLNEDLSDINKDMGIVQSKYSEPVSLKGLEAAPDAAAKIFWMKNTGEVYVDPSNLPMAPVGKQYQLWAIVDGKPVDGGMIFSKDGKKYSIQKMKTFGKAQAFAITLETEGGNLQPKGTMYVMGEI
ncbi:MAG: anti-sigma factor [Ferruginibacter sp.]|nr:anti-sigma factor [Ferruginibacter sp.]